MGSFLLLVELQRSAFSGFASRNRRPPFGGERKRIANRRFAVHTKKKDGICRPFSLFYIVPDLNPSKAFGFGLALRFTTAEIRTPPGAKRGPESLTLYARAFLYLLYLSAGASPRPTICTWLPALS